MNARYSLISQLLTFTLVLVASTTTFAAAPIHWEVDGYFDDGERVDGGFNFDPDTDSFSNITLYEDVGGVSMELQYRGWRLHHGLNRRSFRFF